MPRTGLPNLFDSYAEYERHVNVLVNAGLIEDATNAGKKIFSIEDVGTTTPWQADLTVPALFVVGGERQGIPRTILDKSHTVLGLPMYGFIPSYNLQAAMAMVMGERLRQMEK